MDLSDVLILLGAAVLGVGLWMTVQWWAAVVLGVLAMVFGVLIGLRAGGRSNRA